MNKTIFQSAMVSSLFTLILVGCGGGGGGGSSSDAAPSAVTPGSPVIAQDATYTFDGNAITNVTEKEATSDATLTITTVNGSVEKISIKTPTTEVEWDKASDDIKYDVNDPVIIAANAADTDIGIIANADDPLLNWEYQTFGVWETGFGDAKGTFGAASVGTPTTGSAIPTTGSATFTGLTGGIYIDTAGADYITAGEVTADVDFLDRSIDLTTINTQKVNTITALRSEAKNLDMSGTLKYADGVNSFSGKVSAAGGMTGSSTGQFYGPNAEELAGVFSLEGTGVETYIGGYGGVKQ